MTDGDYKEEIARLRTEVDALTADNAALLEAIGLLTPSHDDAWKRDAHEEGCRAIFDAEEECRCDGAFILGKVAAAKSLPHPGAAMREQHREELASAARRHDTTRATMVVREEWHRKEVAELVAEHRKALVRARNEGLEQAAAAIIQRRDNIHPALKKGNRRGGLEEAASIIRAMKEAE
jgi:hypothetical protein